jgi:ubiquinone biosynthesis protein
LKRVIFERRRTGAHMIESIIMGVRDRARLQEIGGVLAREGLGDLARRIGLGPLFRLPERAASGDNAAARMRRALAALGPVFVKLGQILSTRADLLPPDWTSELEKLQSRVPALPWEDVARHVEAELGAPPEEIFAEFDREPIGSASIAQVYKARLRDGTSVVVKVRRPGLRRVIDADLRILAHIAAQAEASSREIARFRPREIVHHLGAALREELDLANEGRNAEELARNFVDDERVVFPRIHWEYTSQSILVQDFVDGIAPARDGRLEAAGLDGRRIAAVGADAFLRMVLIHGLFHGDPHPGNLLAMKGNRVGFIDFGMLGRIGATRRRQVLDFVRAIVVADPGGLATVLQEWSGAQAGDLAPLEQGADLFIARHGGGGLDLGRAVKDILSLARENALILPVDLVVLFKALATADGVMKRLDPDFDAVEAAAPLMRENLGERLSVGAVKKRATRFAFDMLQASEDLPSTIRLILHRLRAGRVQVDVKIEGIEGLGRSLERSALKLAVALVVAAFAIGLAPELLRIGPHPFGLPLFVITGVVVIVAGAVLLFVKNPFGR